MYSLDEVKKVDEEIAQAIVDEQERQNSHIELIASENWVSKAVMAAMGRQCAAPLRRTGKSGSTVCSLQSGRYNYGNESGSWRTSYPWKSGKHFR